MLMLVSVLEYFKSTSYYLSGGSGSSREQGWMQACRPAESGGRGKDAGIYAQMNVAWPQLARAIKGSRSSMLGAKCKRLCIGWCDE